MYIISGCLLGENCKYHGGNNKDKKVILFIEDKQYISVCPEVMAGFTTPRPPAEILNGRVVNSLGEDITEGFLRGAEIMWQAALKKAEELDENIEGAILKAKSPSCGSGRIYDGSFSGKIINGDGISAGFLKKMGISILTEEDFDDDRL